MNEEFFNVIEDDEIESEYDFSKMSGGVRGKYYQAYRAGHKVKIHKADGTIEEQIFPSLEGIVLLDPDVLAHFPDSEAVNHALRRLIPLLTKQTPATLA